MGTNHNYWAYIPNPPINKWVVWGDVAIPIVVNESSWLPGPYDHRGPTQPKEDGKKIISYTVGMHGIPICMGNGMHCLNITFQIWLSIVNHYLVFSW